MRLHRDQRGAIHFGFIVFAGFVITLMGGILIGYLPHNINLGIALYVIAGTASLLPSAPVPPWLIFASIVITVVTFVLFLAVVFVWHL